MLEKTKHDTNNTLTIDTSCSGRILDWPFQIMNLQDPLGIATSTFHLIQRSHSSKPSSEKCSEMDRKTYWPTISSQTMLKIAELLPF